MLVAKTIDCDHNALILTLTIQGELEPGIKSRSDLGDVSISNNQRTIRWNWVEDNPRALETVKGKVCSEVEELLQKHKDVVSREQGIHHELLYNEITDLLGKPCKEHNMGKDKQKLRSDPHVAWYNQECRKSKGDLVRAVKSNMRLEIVACRARYRQAIELAKKNWEDSLLSSLQRALTARDVKTFWKKAAQWLNGKRTVLEFTVQPEEWVSHFECLYAAGNPEVDDPIERGWGGSGPLGAEDALVFSLEETKVSIHSCVPARAPGPDRIPNDLYREDPTVWGLYINMLTNAFKSGMDNQPS